MTLTGLSWDEGLIRKLKVGRSPFTRFASENFKRTADHDSRNLTTIDLTSNQELESTSWDHEEGALQMEATCPSLVLSTLTVMCTWLSM